MRKRFQYHKVFAGWLLAIVLGWGGNLAAQTEPLGFSLSGASITEKDTFVVVLSADSMLTGRSVYAYRFYISYSPSYFEFLNMEGTGSLLAGWGDPVLNSNNAGVLVMAGAGTEPLTGSGEMIYLKFRSVRSGNSYISFDSNESYLNERNPAAIFTNGYIIMAARSYPNIWPDQQNMYIGDEVQMTVSGGEPPYEYSTGNPEVLQVTDSDRVRAVGPGTSRVTVTDGNGETSTTTGLFDVRAVRIDLEEVSVWPADTFYIPVKLEVAPGTEIYSGRFELAHGSGLSGLDENVLQGDFPVAMEHNPKINRTMVSFASSAGITGNGVLCYLPFRGNNSGNQYIQFENMRFNETLNAWPLKSPYYINVRSLPNLTISPNSGSMMWGEVIKINVYNGTAPYAYTVSDPSLASIDAQGNLTATSGGEVQVTAVDDNGATKTSGIFTIADNQVSILSTDGVLDSDTRVPLITSSLPAGEVIFGYRANISFSETDLDFVRVDPPDGAGLVESSQSGNTVEIAGAMSEGVASGVIGFLVFKIKNSLPLDGTTNITLNSFSANENSLYTFLENGLVHRVEQTSYRPVAIAGLDFSLQEGSTGQLDGTASFDLDNDPLTYRWSAPEGFILSDTTSPTPEFVAPFVSQNTEYTISLIVNDGTDDSDPSEVNVTVLQVNLRPEADAGANLSYVEGSSVSLDGSNSYDPDGDAISFSWNSLDGIVLFNPTSVSPSFILPQVTVNTSYRFTLVVNDGALNSLMDTVSITALQVNKKPVAFAGGDFSLNEQEVGTLDGSLSYDADNDPLTYLWTAPSGVALSSNTVAGPTFTAPAVHRDSVLEFVLVVNDGSRDSDPDVVRATIINLDSLSMEALIDSVFMPTLDSFVIDTAQNLVTMYMPYGLDVHALSPGFALSTSATIHPASGSTHNFSMPVYYTVTAEDGITNRLWKVVVFRPERIVHRALYSGWNWISLNVQPPDMDISTLMGGLTLTDLDYIKSASYSSVYYSATGWFGSLTAFPQHRMVKFSKSVAETLEVVGLEINPAISPVPLVEGWNDIAYLLRSSEDINASIDPVSIPSGDVVIKGSGGSAVYYTGSGWAGELDSLKVLHGYKLHVENAGNLMYNAAASSKKSVPVSYADHRLLLREYGLHPESFEYSATLIAKVATSGMASFIGPDDRLIAYYGNEIRGVSGARYIPALDTYLFILTYYSNEEDQQIRFTFESSPDRTDYETDLVIHFKPDAISGKAYDPMLIVLNNSGVQIRHRSPASISIYPNPVSDHLIINASVPLEKLSIQDLSGKKIMEINPGSNTITIPVDHLAPGIYTLEAETSEEIIIRKIVKTSY